MRSRKLTNKRRKQIRKPKKKVREKFFLEDTPGVDLDFIETSLPTRERYLKEDDLYNDEDNSEINRYSKFKSLDEFIFEHAERYLRQKNRPYGDLLRDKKRIEKLQYKLDKAASLYFTDIQFKVYVLRYKCHAKEKEIAYQLGCNQSHVSHVLRSINVKLIDLLRLNKRKRKYKQHFQKPSKPPTSK